MKEAILSVKGTYLALLGEFLNSGAEIFICRAHL